MGVIFNIKQTLKLNFIAYSLATVIFAPQFLI